MANNMLFKRVGSVMATAFMLAAALPVSAESLLKPPASPIPAAVILPVAEVQTEDAEVQTAPKSSEAAAVVDAVELTPAQPVKKTGSIVSSTGMHIAGRSADDLMGKTVPTDTAPADEPAKQADQPGETTDAKEVQAVLTEAQYQEKMQGLYDTMWSITQNAAALDPSDAKGAASLLRDIRGEFAAMAELKAPVKYQGMQSKIKSGSLAMVTLIDTTLKYANGGTPTAADQKIIEDAMGTAMSDLMSGLLQAQQAFPIQTSAYRTAA